MEEGLVKDWFATITFLDNFVWIRRLLKSDVFLAIEQRRGAKGNNLLYRINEYMIFFLNKLYPFYRQIFVIDKIENENNYDI